MTRNKKKKPQPPDKLYMRQTLCVCVKHFIPLSLLLNAICIWDYAFDKNRFVCKPKAGCYIYKGYAVTNTGSTCPCHRVKIFHKKWSWWNICKCVHQVKSKICSIKMMKYRENAPSSFPSILNLCLVMNRLRWHKLGCMTVLFITKWWECS